MSDYAVLDPVLAIAHHVLAFGVAALIAYELATVRADMSISACRRLARADGAYGLSALALIAVGVARAVYAAKGWDYYADSVFFWCKLAAFAVVGVLSVIPTLAFLRWRRGQASPDAREIARVRRLIWAQALVFPVIPTCAALMARLA